MKLAEMGHRSAVARLAALQGESLSGVGWHAVRTGADSNDLNGVVSDGSVDQSDLELVLSWLDGVPASWLTTRHDPSLTAALIARGAVPERTGHWCGGPLAPTSPALAEPVDDPQSVLDVLAACDWFAEPVDLSDIGRRRPLLVHAMADEAWGHWCVRRSGEPVGVVTAFAGPALEIVDVAVLPADRRAGVARTLVDTACRWGRSRGLDQMVAAPSPDGAALFRALGYAFADVDPDVCFYLSSASG